MILNAFAVRGEHFYEFHELRCEHDIFITEKTRSTDRIEADSKNMHPFSSRRPRQNMH